jgi:hypothetical protein
MKATERDVDSVATVLFWPVGERLGLRIDQQALQVLIR